MKKYTFGKYELEFDDEFVQEFEENVPDIFKDCIKGYLQTDFQCTSLAEIFETHTIEEITEVIISAAKQEIALYKGENYAPH